LKSERTLNASPEDIEPPPRTMKTLEFAKERFMSSKKVSDLLHLDAGITLIEKGEVNRGADL
jgi:hypothetical protein